MAGNILGFVIAMRARLELSGAKTRSEWLIVARWGKSGQYLSISCTGVSARGAVAPIGLKPRSTALARLVRVHNGHAENSFSLLQRLPRGVALAGEFLRTEGVVHLGEHANQAAAAGRCMPGRAHARWRLAAVRVAWAGEFIESPTPATTNARLTLGSRNK